MTVSGFLTDQAGVGRGLSLGPSTGFGDVFGAGLTNQWVQGVGGSLQFMGQPLNERNDTIKQRFGQDIYDVTGVRKKYPNPTSEGFLEMTKEANAQIDDWILKGRAEFPEKYNGIKTTAEIQEGARTVAGMNERHFSEMMLRNPSGVSRVVGGFMGTMTGALIDPPNLLTLPLGAGEMKAGLKGFQAARAIMKAAVIDGTVNAAIEGAQQPYIMEWQKTLGHKYGFGDAVENTAMAFVGGAGLSAMIRGAAHGLKRPLEYMGSVSADVLDRIASNEKMPAMVRDAASFLSRQAHIDEAAPPGTIKTGEDIKVHRDTAQKISDDFENYQTQTAAHVEAVDMPVKSEEVTPETAQPENQGKPLETNKVTDKKAEKEITDPVKEFNVAELERRASLKPPKEQWQPADNLITEYKKGLNEYLQKTGKKQTAKTEVEYLKSLGDDTFEQIDEAYTTLKLWHEADAAEKKLAEIKGSSGGAQKMKKAGAEQVPERVSSEPAKDTMDDMIPAERFQEAPKLPEGVTPEASADRVAIAESDLKALVDELGDEKITLEDGRTVSIKDFADEVKGKKALIEAMKTCRIA